MIRRVFDACALFFTRLFVSDVADAQICYLVLGVPATLGTLLLVAS